jgi:hypothetical protein
MMGGNTVGEITGPGTTIPGTTVTTPGTLVGTVTVTIGTYNSLAGIIALNRTVSPASTPGLSPISSR